MLNMDERLRQVVVRGHLVVDAAEQARAVRALNSDILGQIDIDSAENRGDAYRYLFVYLRLAQINFKTAEDCDERRAGCRSCSYKRRPSRPLYKWAYSPAK